MFETCTADDLGLAMGQLHGLSTASTAQLLGVIAEYDRRGAYVADGSSSMVEWLKLRFCVSGETAARWVRVARRLRELPAIAAALSEGLLSFDQVRVVVGFATPESDASLAERAQAMTVAELQRLGREGRRVDGEAQHHRRYVQLTEDDELAMMRIRGLLPLLEGKALKARLAEEAADAPLEPVTNCSEPRGCRICGRRRFTQIHHLVSWFDGGVTDLGEVTLMTPGGRAVAKGPPPLRADIRQRMLGEVA